MAMTMRLKFSRRDENAPCGHHFRRFNVRVGANSQVERPHGENGTPATLFSRVRGGSLFLFLDPLEGCPFASCLAN